MQARSLGLVIACVLIAGCGETETAARPPPAGRQPLPSSSAAPAPPSGGGSVSPMFAGGSDHSDFGARLARTPRIREARAWEEAQKRRPGPIRIGGEYVSNGDLGRQMLAAADEAPDGSDACDEAWRARAVMSERTGASSTRAEERDFLAACRALPEAQRNCESPLYYRDHNEECDELRAEATARARREIRRVTQR